MVGGAGRESYVRATRAPRYSVLFALPLLLAYEGLAFLLGGDAIEGVRNGADVLLKSAFVVLGGRRGLLVFSALLVGAGGWLVARDLRRGGGVRGAVFAGMLAESVAYAVALGFVASRATAKLLEALPGLAQGAFGGFDLPTRLMVSLGAGLYEELLFRVLLVSALAAVARRGLNWGTAASGGLAAVLGALVFSAFHYVGPYGDAWQVTSFTYRAIAGLIFSGLYLLRGFGITAWTHALYDVLVSLAE